MGTVFDIQTYAIHDGPGIRTCVFFKGCPLRCSWCHNPESQRRQTQLSYQPSRCTVCGVCVEACPEGALAMGASRVLRDESRCTTCGHCVEVCARQAVELIGYEISAEDLACRVLLDRPFFEHSGGGVTLTGGEPTAQPEFLVQVLERLRGEGIHTALETCGNYGRDLAVRLVDLVDLFLFDIKHLSCDLHRRATGAGNERILDNFSWTLSEAGQDRVVPRIPVVPGFNSDPASMGSIAGFLARQGYENPVHLMAYHGWARDKYDRLGRPSKQCPAGSLSRRDKANVQKLFFERGLAPVWS